MQKSSSQPARCVRKLQKELAEILQREVHDRRLGFVTVNEVVLSKDLAVARSISLY